MATCPVCGRKAILYSRCCKCSAVPVKETETATPKPRTKTKKEDTNNVSSKH